MNSHLNSLKLRSTPDQNNCSTLLVTQLCQPQSLRRILLALCTASLILLGARHSSRLLLNDYRSSAGAIGGKESYSEHEGYHAPMEENELVASGGEEDALGRMGANGFWLKDLGPGAEEAFNLNLDLRSDLNPDFEVAGYTPDVERSDARARSRKAYLEMLGTFIRKAMPASTRPGLERSLNLYLQDASTRSTHHPTRPHLPAMTSFPFIHQTDKAASEQSDASVEAWSIMNGPTGSEVEQKGWEIVFYDDDRAWRFVRSLETLNLDDHQKEEAVPPRKRRIIESDMDKDEIVPAGEDGITFSEMNWAWEAMRRGVLQADYFRYLVMLFEGGVYSDIDTVPLKPINHWGTVQPDYHDISSTDGLDWMEEVMRGGPSVVVGVDVDVHKLMDWRNGWPRPLGFCQWTLASSPHHPIHIDAVRRVINATRYIEDYAEGLPEMIASVEKGRAWGWREEVKKLRKMLEDRVGILEVMEHTGPGIWTDAVLAYLKARYDVSWHDLRGLARPLRIGEVLILPITAFSPGGQPDFHAGDRADPQAALFHDFRGSWKSEGF